MYRTVRVLVALGAAAVCGSVLLDAYRDVRAPRREPPRETARPPAAVAVAPDDAASSRAAVAAAPFVGRVPDAPPRAPDERLAARIRHVAKIAGEPEAARVALVDADTAQRVWAAIKEPLAARQAADVAASAAADPLLTRKALRGERTPLDPARPAVQPARIDERVRTVCGRRNGEPYAYEVRAAYGEHPELDAAFAALMDADQALRVALHAAVTEERNR